jgi:hypothetical protein
MYRGKKKTRGRVNFVGFWFHRIVSVVILKTWQYNWQIGRFWFVLWFSSNSFVSLLHDWTKSTVLTIVKFLSTLLKLFICWEPRLNDENFWLSTQSWGFGCRSVLSSSQFQSFYNYSFILTLKEALSLLEPYCWRNEMMTVNWHGDLFRPSKHDKIMIEVSNLLSGLDSKNINKTYTPYGMHTIQLHGCTPTLHLYAQLQDPIYTLIHNIWFSISYI